jgi:hypothetical protein
MAHDPDTDRLWQIRLRDGSEHEFDAPPKPGSRLRPGLSDEHYEARKLQRRGVGIMRLITATQDLSDLADRIMSIRSGDLLSASESESGFEREPTIPTDALGQRLCNLTLAANRAYQILRAAMDADAEGWPDDGKGVDRAA